MKKLQRTLTTLTVLVLFLSSAFANQFTISKDHPKYKQIEDNLIAGVQSENTGVKASTAYMLGELKSERAVKYLEKLLRIDVDERVSLMAALSLVKIETERSVYIVRRVAEFTDNDRLARMCKKFHDAYLYNQSVKDNISQQIKYASLL